MAKPTIELLTVPCTVTIKLNGRKVVKKVYACVHHLLSEIGGSLEYEATYKIAKQVYKK